MQQDVDFVWRGRSGEFATTFVSEDATISFSDWTPVIRPALLIDKLTRQGRIKPLDPRDVPKHRQHIV